MTVWQGIIWCVLTLLGGIVVDARFPIWVTGVAATLVVTAVILMVFYLEGSYTETHEFTAFPLKFATPVMAIGAIGFYAGRGLVIYKHQRSGPRDDDYTYKRFLAMPYIVLEAAKNKVIVAWRLNVGVAIALRVRKRKDQVAAR